MIKYEVVQKDPKSYKIILNFIMKQDKFFPNPLSERVNLKEFSEKIFNKAIILKASLNEKIVAMVSCYANNSIDLKAHLTFLAVDINHRKEGIAARLIKDMFDILRQKKMISVELTTETENVSARSLYEKIGFDLAEETDGRVKYIYYLEKERL